MPMPAMRLATLSLLVAAAAGTCTSADDCSLLGKCAKGSCVCGKGWTGSSCSRGDFAPLDVSLGYHNATEASWGGRPIKDPVSGKWQLMATEIKRHCPLILFQYNSMVVRAESTTDDAGGPYVHKETVLPPFHHNPTFVGPTPDGYYLLFYIGTNRPSHELDCPLPFTGWANCTPSKRGCKIDHPTPKLKSNGYTTMAYTKDIVKGPWKQKIVLRNNDFNTTDPANKQRAHSE